MLRMTNTFMILTIVTVIVSVKMINGASISIVPLDVDQFTSDAVLTKDFTTPTLVRCYCNTPECLTTSDGIPICTSRYGCFISLDHTVPVHGTEAITAPPTTRLPAPEKLIEKRIMVNVKSQLDDAYGCLDILTMNQTCNIVFRSPDSELPAIETSAMCPNSIVPAYYCCQRDMCNEQSQVVTTIQEAPEVFKVTIRNSTPVNQEHETHVQRSDNTINELNSTTTAIATTPSTITGSDLMQSTMDVEMLYTTSPNVTTKTDYTTTIILATAKFQNDTVIIDNSTFLNIDQFIVYVPPTFDNKSIAEESSGDVENTRTVHPAPSINIPIITVETVGVSNIIKSNLNKLQEIDFIEYVAPINMTYEEKIKFQRSVNAINKREEEKKEQTTVNISSREIDGIMRAGDPIDITTSQHNTTSNQPIQFSQKLQKEEVIDVVANSYIRTTVDGPHHKRHTNTTEDVNDEHGFETLYTNIGGMINYVFNWVFTKLIIIFMVFLTIFLVLNIILILIILLK